MNKTDRHSDGAQREKRPAMGLNCPRCDFVGQASPDDGCPDCGSSFFVNIRRAA